VDTAHRKNRKVGICGEAPSNYPDFAEFLAEIGIDSISLNPDSIAGVTHRLAAPGPQPALPEALGKPAMTGVDRATDGE
jgi:pyruvate,water dikinase